MCIRLPPSIRNGFVTIASVASVGAPGLANYTDTTINLPVVNNELYSYHVRVYSASWPGNSLLKIKGLDNNVNFTPQAQAACVLVRRFGDDP